MVFCSKLSITRHEFGVAGQQGHKPEMMLVVDSDTYENEKKWNTKKRNSTYTRLFRGLMDSLNYIVRSMHMTEINGITKEIIKQLKYYVADVRDQVEIAMNESATDVKTSIAKDSPMKKTILCKGLENQKRKSQIDCPQ